MVFIATRSTWKRYRLALRYFDLLVQLIVLILRLPNALDHTETVFDCAGGNQALLAGTAERQRFNEVPAVRRGAPF